MYLIVCLDDRGGMLFNHRRQSQDLALRADLLAMTRGSRLYMSDWSAKPFGDTPGITRSPDPLEEAGSGDWCFLEDRPLGALADRVEKLVIYRWNRTYPADLFFDLSLRGWHLESSADFPGSSHEKITKETYIP